MALGRMDLSEDERLKLMQKENKTPPEMDRDIFEDVDLMRLTIRSSGEAFAQGYNGVMDDGKKSATDFGFRIQDIREDLTIHLWYGKRDCYVPLIHGTQIAARLGGRAQFRVEDESHAGILMHWKGEILKAIGNSM
jgi:hypothetical protein